MRVAVIAGEGSGIARLMRPTIKLVESLASRPVVFEEREFTDTAGIRKADAGLFGSVARPSAQRKDYVSPIITLRRELDLFAVVYPLPDDVLLVREATEDFFVGRERMEGPDVAIAERRVSRQASERVAQLAFLLALKRHAGDDDVQRRFQRQKPRKEASVTVAHKVNVMPLTEGLFLGAARAVAEQYRGRVALRDAPADTLASHLCLAHMRQRLDVVLTTNMFGDILGDVGAGVSGGLSRMAAASTGKDGWLLAHGSNLVSGDDNHPAALVRASAMVLNSLGDHNVAHALETAVAKVLRAAGDDDDYAGDKFFDRVHQAADYELHLMNVSNA